MRTGRSISAACAAALAAISTAAVPGEREVRATLARTFPGGAIQAVAPTPVPGLFEAAVEGQMYYVSQDGRYILAGPLVDAIDRVNLTEARLEAINTIPWVSLPLDLAVKRVKGAGTRRIAIFEDPDCPYCKVLEKTLSGMDDLTVYVLLYPIDTLHPQAAAKSKAVWCAADRAKAWDDVMRTGVAPDGASDCDNPIARIAEFAKRHHINGTPTTVLPDGRRLVGAVSRVELENQIRRAAKR
jgi:thiol:disulfide interchange protein DsbC